MIIYEPDENYDYPRIKNGIRDGTSEKTDDMLVSNLPFAFPTGGGGGENGATFTPSVSTDGKLSWTNDKGLENPPSVNIKGADGYTPVKGVDYFDGVNGKDGKDGADGYTPVRGTDYWTSADKAEIKSYVDEAILGGAW